MVFNVSFKKKESDELAAMRDIADDVVEQDFIPYACHYDPETLLTKNGELMQTVKIVGFTFEAVNSDSGGDLRDTLRQAVRDGLDSDDFAVWLHTIRSRKNLAPAGGDNYREPFPKYVHDVWNARHDWEHKYINELYITIVREGETGSIKKLPRFLRGLSPARDAAEREQQLRMMHDELNTAVARMLEYLAPFGARKLGIYEQEDGYYSEPMRFLGKILKLRDEEVALDYEDISSQLATDDVTFAFDAMESRSPNGVRRFGAMLTVKEYRELSLASIDEFLQLPQEFVVTQSMDFITNESAYKPFKQQHYIIGLSNDDMLARVTGLNDFVNSAHGRATDYGEHQLTIFLTADDLKQLNRCVERAMTALDSLGIVAMREDLRLEESYWAQLPANFPFLKRLRPINTARIGGFANLSNYPAGRAEDNHWGPAVTVFNTAANTPYFFNFHSGDIGHTTIIGPYGAGKTVLLNFLLSESRKFNNKLFFFDQNHGAEIFLRAMGGRYASFKPAKSDIPMNPLKLDDTPGNRNFLLLWVEALICGASGMQLSGTQDKAVEQAVTRLFGIPREERNLRRFAVILGEIDEFLGKRLGPWHSGGSHSGLFDHEEDKLEFTTLVHGFEMADIVKDKHSVAPTMLYLIQRLMGELDGNPAIIVLDEAWGLMDNPVFAPRLHGWLKALTAKNAMAIFATESVEDASQSALSKAVFADIATQIYLPNPEPSRAYQAVFGLDEVEYRYLSLMQLEKRHFLLKKGGDAIVASLNLDGMDNIMNVLSATPQSLGIMRMAIAEKGKEPNAWVPYFMEKMGEANG